MFPLTMFLAADRAGMKYRRYATEGKALAEAQLSLADRFGLDAITACSDAFRITADLGADMAYPEDQTPYSRSPLVASRAELEALPEPDPRARGSRMADRAEAVAEMVRAAGKERLVLGWIDMPFAEACSVCKLDAFMMMLYDDPGLAHSILAFLTRVAKDFAAAQIEAGAPMIGAGDAAASLISPKQFREFALPYEMELIEFIHARKALVKLHICGNTSALLPDMARSGADLFNVDHMVDFDEAVRVYGNAGLAYKGNLDPVGDFLDKKPEEVREAALSLIARARGTKYMLSAGCEIPPSVEDAALEAFCGAVLD